MISVRQPAPAPQDVIVMVSGYLLFMVAASLYLRSVQRGVEKDRQIRDAGEKLAGKDRAIDALDERLAVVEAERDFAVENWTGWSKRAMRAETANEQGPPPPRARRCLTTARRDPV